MLAQLCRAVGAHVAFEGRGGQAGVGGLPLARGQTDQDVAGLVVQADGRGRQQVAEAVGNQLRLAVAPDADRAVGRTQINADNHAGPRLLLRLS
ncbi:NAD-specific glutamate dehydrogenase [compost metagenome]